MSIPVTAREILQSTLSPADQSALRADRDEQLRERGHIDELVAEVAAAYPATRDEDTVIGAEEWRKALLAL